MSTHHAWPPLLLGRACSWGCGAEGWLFPGLRSPGYQSVLPESCRFQGLIPWTQPGVTRGPVVMVPTLCFGAGFKVTPSRVLLRLWGRVPLSRGRCSGGWMRCPGCGAGPCRGRPGWRPSRPPPHSSRAARPAGAGRLPAWLLYEVTTRFQQPGPTPSGGSPWGIGELPAAGCGASPAHGPLPGVVARRGQDWGKWGGRCLVRVPQDFSGFRGRGRAAAGFLKCSTNRSGLNNPQSREW